MSAMSAECCENKSEIKLPVISIVITACALAVYLLPDACLKLYYLRPALAADEWWRIPASNFAHRSFTHFFWDSFPFLILAGFCELENRKAFIAAIILSMISAPLAVHLWLPEVGSVGGLSGMAHAMFMLAAIIMIKDGLRSGDRQWLCICALIIVGFCAYAGYELTTGRTVFGENIPGMTLPGPVCHLAGLLSGGLAGLFPSRYCIRKPKRIHYS